MRTRRWHPVAALLLGCAVVAGSAAGCTPGQIPGGPGLAASTTDLGELGDGRGEITIWFHSTAGAERTTLEDQVRRFNALGTGVQVTVAVLPDGDYSRQVWLTAREDKLPDLLDVDGPSVPSYVYQGRIVPLNTLLPARVTGDQIDSVKTQGTVEERLYAAAQVDSGLAVYVNRRLARAAGVRVPTGLRDPWTAAEFGQALASLARGDRDRKVLDLQVEHDGEPYTYTVAPVVWSAGGDLIDRPGHTSARGVLDKPAVVAALEQFQSWQRYVDPDPQHTSFQAGDVAVSWADDSRYPAYARALGRDLAVVPLPDFGSGVKSSQGSWTWVMPKRSVRKRAASRFLEFLLSPAEVARTAAAAGAVPGTKSVLARSATYGPRGPLELVAAQLQRSCGTGAVGRQCVAVPAPPTPGYPALSAAFGRAVQDVLAGADVRGALAAAVQDIDQDFARNRDYRLQ